MYVNSALAKTEANLAGFDDGIILTPEGHVSEGAVTNTFVVVKGRLITPPPCDSILLGITRNTVMQLARNELGLYTIERSLVRSDLYAAEEVFFTGTYAGVVPIVEIDNRPVRTGDTGPLTARLKEMYTEVALGRNPKCSDWYAFLEAQ
jgi:branched-chain amino acid aminotransferase